MTTLIPSFFVLLLFACLVTYHYIRDLRRERDEAKTRADHFARAYARTDRQLRDAQGKTTPPDYYDGFDEDEPRESGFKPGAVGPWAINDRERRREREDRELREPRFANREVLTGTRPSPDRVAAAAREAVDGENLN